MRIPKPRDTNSTAPRKIGRPRQSELNQASSDVEEVSKDPDWVPPADAQKRLRHRYQSRRRRQWRIIPSEPEQRKLLPGEFDITLSPTPANSADAPKPIERTSPKVSEDDSRRRPAAYHKVHFNIDNFGTKSRLNGSSETLHLLRTSWLRFLYITAPKEEPRNTGAKSLLSMALKSTSSWILKEQQLADEDEDDIDVADDVFTHLENTYGQGNGWRPLKELVRQHGIRLVCEAIHKCSLPVSLIEHLGQSTRGERHWDAVEAIYAAYRESMAPRLDKPTKSLHSFGSSYETYRPYDMIIEYRKYLPGGSFTWREMAKSISDGKIPVEWIPALSMQDVVTEALKSIVAEDAHSKAASEFISSVIKASIGLHQRQDSTSVKKDANRRSQIRDRPPRSIKDKQAQDRSDEHAEALNNSVASFLKILGVAHTKYDAQRAGSDNLHTITIMYAIVSDILSNFNQIARRGHLRDEEKLRCGYVFVVFFVYMTNGSNNSSCLDIFETFIESLKDRSFLVSGLASFVINLCCGRRSDPESGYPCLQQIVSLFLTPDGACYPTIRALLGKVAVDAALDFAAMTLLPEHHDFATSVQRQVEARRVKCAVELTPSLAMRGYKWEDGFGEWVVSTSAPVRGHKNQRVVFSDSDLSDADDELRTDTAMSPRQEAIVYDSQDDATIVSSQSSSVFSASPVRCTSISTTPSPSKKRAVDFDGDQSDISEAGWGPTKKPRCSKLERELQKLRCSLIRDDLCENDDNDDKLLQLSAPRHHRRLRPPKKQPNPQGRSGVTTGPRHLRPRRNDQAKLTSTVQNQDLNGNGDATALSTSKTCSQRNSASVGSYMRYALRERRSFNNASIKHSTRTAAPEPLNVCNLAIVINNSAYKPPSNVILFPESAVAQLDESPNRPRSAKHMSPKAAVRETSPIVMETDYELDSEDDVVNIFQRSPVHERRRRPDRYRLKRAANLRLGRANTATSLKRGLTSFIIPENESDDELSILN